MDVATIAPLVLRTAFERLAAPAFLPFPFTPPGAPFAGAPFRVETLASVLFGFLAMEDVDLDCPACLLDVLLLGVPGRDGGFFLTVTLADFGLEVG